MSRTILAGALVVAATACAMAQQLPLSPLGYTVMVHPLNGRPFSGELISVDSNSCIMDLRRPFLVTSAPSDTAPDTTAVDRTVSRLMEVPYIAIDRIALPPQTLSPRRNGSSVGIMLALLLQLVPGIAFSVTAAQFDAKPLVIISIPLTLTAFGVTTSLFVGADKKRELHSEVIANQGQIATARLRPYSRFPQGIDSQALNVLLVRRNQPALEHLGRRLTVVEPVKVPPADSNPPATPANNRADTLSVLRPPEGEDGANRELQDTTANSTAPAGMAPYITDTLGRR
jgi:hypothetical protein